jgi:hypothetical protein
LRIRKAKPVNDRSINTQGGHGFDSRQLHSLKKRMCHHASSFFYFRANVALPHSLATKTTDIAKTTPQVCDKSFSTRQTYLALVVLVLNESHH